MELRVFPGELVLLTELGTNGTNGQTNCDRLCRTCLPKCTLFYGNGLSPEGGRWGGRADSCAIKNACHLNISKASDFID